MWYLEGGQRDTGKACERMRMDWTHWSVYMTYLRAAETAVAEAKSVEAGKRIVEGGAFLRRTSAVRGRLPGLRSCAKRRVVGRRGS